MKISETYLNFFKRTSSERIIFLRGGRRSGKTFAIFYKFAHNFEKGSGGDVLVTAPSHSALGTLMNDFSEVFGVEPEYRQKKGEYRVHWFGGLFRFRIFSTVQEAKGTKAKWLWINEGDGLPAEIYETLILGITKQIVCDHNPTQNFWGTDLQNENNTLITSYADNIYLTPAQVMEFEEIRRRGENAPAGTPERVRYEQQILGNYSKITGKIFTNSNMLRQRLNESDFEDCEKIIVADPSSLRGADYFAACMACKQNGKYYFLRYFSVNVGSKREVAEVLFRWQQETDAEVFVETNGIIGIDFFEYCDNMNFAVSSYTNSGNKFERITANYDLFTNECIFNDTPSSDSFFEQIFDFSEKCEHDDNIDCMNTALQILKYK